MNLLLIAVGVVLVWKVISGFKRGMVKEVVSLVTLLITCATVALIANALSHYTKGEFLNVVIMLIMLAILGAVHVLLRIVFVSAKLIVKLPIVSWADKLLGIVAGILETALLLWTLYFFVMTMEMGGISEQILQYTRDSEILKWFFENNYLALLLGKISQKVQYLPFYDTWSGKIW